MNDLNNVSNIPLISTLRVPDLWKGAGDAFIACKFVIMFVSCYLCQLLFIYVAISISVFK